MLAICNLKPEIHRTKKKTQVLCHRKDCAYQLYCSQHYNDSFINLIFVHVSVYIFFRNIFSISLLKSLFQFTSIFAFAAAFAS